MLGVQRRASLIERIADFASKDRFLIGTSLLRIGFAILVLLLYVIHYKQRYFLWGADGVYGYEEDFRATVWSLYNLGDSLQYFDIIYHLGIIVTIVHLLGWKGRLTSFLFFVFTFSLIERSVYITDGGDNLLRVVLVYLLFTNNTAYFSLDSKKFWEKYEQKRTTLRYQMSTVVHNFAVLTAIIQLCVLYLTSGLFQAMGEMWNTGTALYYILQVDTFANPNIRDFILQSDLLIVAGTLSSILIKLAFPFLLFNRTTKWIAVIGVFGFHIGIALFMGLITFSASMCLMDLLLISDKEYVRLRIFSQRVVRRIRLALRTTARPVARTAWMRSHRVVVFYDGWCPFCRASVRNLKRLDLFRALQFVSFREPGVVEENGLNAELAEKRMHSKRVGETKLHDGVHAFLQISKRLPTLWLILPFMLVAKWIGIGQWAYDFVASRRTIVPAGGCDDQCFINSKPTVSS